MIRVPTVEQIQMFEGGKFQKRWDHIRSDWSCPACKRTKRQIIYVTESGTLNWQVEKHHDHGTDFSLPRRFYPTFLCQLCNNADAVAKRQLYLPYYFSFTPWEISKFITSEPHMKHAIDFDKAQAIFNNVSAGKWSEEVKKWKDEDGTLVQTVNDFLEKWLPPKELI